jgi:hypothetical protein
MNIEDLLPLPDGPRKTAALVAWIQAFSEADDAVPVLVGGAAVELFTGGGYTTGDLDLVGPVSPELQRSLNDAGFAKHGRHWIHEEAQIFIEFPGDTLGPDEETRDLEFDGTHVRIISLEDLVVDRLGAWQHWQSSVDGVNALLLWRSSREKLDMARLERRTRDEGWDRALARLQEFVTHWARSDPPASEVEKWANRWP